MSTGSGTAWIVARQEEETDDIVESDTAIQDNPGRPVGMSMQSSESYRR